MLAGDAYCTVLEGCQEIFDLRRAYEWTTSLARWCAAQPDLVRYRGECLLYRAEVMQLRGHWDDAAQDAQDACELLTSRPAAGAAFYRLGEIHRLRGEFAKAEAAYTRANERGRKPQPGLSLLRLAQGQIEAAAASIRNVLLDTRAQASPRQNPRRGRRHPAGRRRPRAARARLPTSCRDRTRARMPRSYPRRPRMPPARSSSRKAMLRVRRRRSARPWRSGAISRCRTKRRTPASCWPAVCERRDDQDGRRLELENARRLFKQLNAERVPGAHQQSKRTEARVSSIGSLSEREVQVLRLLAAGKTNRDIAEELFISEKTVARHVSNIFDKLGVSSRAGATAWAYQRNLI